MVVLVGRGNFAVHFVPSLYVKLMGLEMHIVQHIARLL